MSLYLDPDTDQTSDSPLFELPAHLRNGSQSMHAAAVVIGRFGVLLSGPTGSGKSLLQRHLRQLAQARGLYAALISDDYVQLARAPLQQQNKGAEAICPPLLAFAPFATRGFEEVRGLGVLAISGERFVDHAVIHLLVDLMVPEQIERMPTKTQRLSACLGHPIPRLAVPQRSTMLASDLIFAQLSTWKDGG